MSLSRIAFLCMAFPLFALAFLMTAALPTQAASFDEPLQQSARGNTTDSTDLFSQAAKIKMNGCTVSTVPGHPGWRCTDSYSQSLVFCFSKASYNSTTGDTTYGYACSWLLNEKQDGQSTQTELPMYNKCERTGQNYVNNPEFLCEPLDSLQSLLPDSGVFDLSALPSGDDFPFQEGQG